MWKTSPSRLQYTSKYVSPNTEKSQANGRDIKDREPQASARMDAVIGRDKENEGVSPADEQDERNRGGEQVNLAEPNDKQERAGELEKERELAGEHPEGANKAVQGEAEAGAREQVQLLILL